MQQARLLNQKARLLHVAIAFREAGESTENPAAPDRDKNRKLQQLQPTQSKEMTSDAFSICFRLTGRSQRRITVWRLTGIAVSNN